MKLRLISFLFVALSCFGQVDINTGTRGILQTSRGGTGVNSSSPFAQIGIDINTSFQVKSLHLSPTPTACAGAQFAQGIDASGNAVCATPAGAGTVSTTGSPASGNLAKFSAATTITNGDLSGDVTTSGTFVTTLATVNGAPGACGDATHVCAVTTNGKGLVTSQTATAITYPSAVTSVGLALPGALFSISGSPVTGVGTLTGTFASISAHRYLGNNTTGAATAALVQPNTLDLSDFPAQAAHAGQYLTTDGVSTLSWGTPAAYQVNGVPLLSQTTINLNSAAAFNGLTLAFSNPSAGNITPAFSGTLNNAGLTNSSTNVMGETCTLGSTCYPTGIVQLAQVAAIGASTILTPSGNATYRATATLTCTTSSAAATVNVTLSWTDTSNTAQTKALGSAVDCTALGASSIGNMVFAFRAKSGVAIQYATTIVNTPTYDVTVQLEKISSN